MKIKYLISLLWLLGTQSPMLFAQTSPVKWINNTYNIHVDTLSIENADITSYYTLLRYTFKNIGEHVTFIDTSQLNLRTVTKPGDTATVSISLPSDLYKKIRRKQDTTFYTSLPFYYEGKIYMEKVAYRLTFGRSKLIRYDNLCIDATKAVSEFVCTNPSLKLEYYFTIKNISGKPIFCSKEFIAYNDNTHLNNYKYVEILPGQSYKIPARLYMDRKYRFKCSGKIEVFSKDAREEYYCEIISKYEREAK